MIAVHFLAGFLMFLAYGITARLIQGWLGDSRAGVALAYAH